MEVNWSNINTAIDALKRREFEEDDFFQNLQNRVEVLRLIDQMGMPYQETQLDENDKPFGIPATLADLVLDVFQFCADHNIDLVRSIEAAA